MRSLARFAALAGIGLAALAALAAAPAGAQSSTCAAGAPFLQLADPNPGDVLPTGDLIVSGIAFDPGATDGSGISHVDLFLGSRDDGGVILGSVAPTGRAFSVRASVPNTANGSRDFVAYAFSAADGQQTSVSIPVFIGAAPTPTPTSSTSTARRALTSTTESTCRTVAPATSDNVPAFRPLPLPSNLAAPVLQLANPSSGDVLSTGDVIIEGAAYDPTSTEGAGVDRVELFLDSRESGGLLLGSGIPGALATESPRVFHIKASVPSGTNGQHSLVAYARSSVTGQETVVSVNDVFFGAAPTPTPRPTSS